MVIKKTNSNRGDVLIALAIKCLPHVLSVVPMSYCSPKFSSVALYLPQNRVVVWNNNNNNNNTDSFVFLTCIKHGEYPPEIYTVRILLLN
jgi:hypothetical protein